MIGQSGTYAINGVDLGLMPSTGRWLVRQSIGIDGDGRSIYPAYRDFEMTFDLISTSDLDTLLTYQKYSTTGTVSVDLPQWSNSSYSFATYSGTVIDDIETGEYFMGYFSNVRMRIRKIRTD